MFTYEILSDSELFLQYFLNEINSKQHIKLGAKFNEITENFRLLLLQNATIRIASEKGNYYLYNSNLYFANSDIWFSSGFSMGFNNQEFLRNTSIPLNIKENNYRKCSDCTFDYSGSKCSGCRYYANVKFSYHKYLSRLRNHLSILYDDTKYGIIRLICNDNKTVSFHKVLLTENSDYFKIIDHNQSKDFTKPNEYEYEIPCLLHDSESILALKSCLYEIPPIFGKENLKLFLFSLYQILDHYQFDINIGIKHLQYYSKEQLNSFLTEIKDLPKTPFLCQFIFFIKLLQT